MATTKPIRIVVPAGTGAGVVEFYIGDSKVCLDNCVDFSLGISPNECSEVTLTYRAYGGIEIVTEDAAEPEPVDRSNKELAALVAPLLDEFKPPSTNVVDNALEFARQAGKRFGLTPQERGRVSMYYCDSMMPLGDDNTGGTADEA